MLLNSSRSRVMAAEARFEFVDDGINPKSTLKVIPPTEPPRPRVTIQYSLERWTGDKEAVIV